MSISPVFPSPIQSGKKVIAATRIPAERPPSAVVRRPPAGETSVVSSMPKTSRCWFISVSSNSGRTSTAMSCWLCAKFIALLFCISVIGRSVSEIVKVGFSTNSAAETGNDDISPKTNAVVVSKLSSMCSTCTAGLRRIVSILPIVPRCSTTFAVELVP